MLFNSLEFVIFLPVVFILYWFILNKSTKLQNALIFVASYVFYGWWDWRFLSLIFLSTIVDYISGLNIEKSQHLTKRKIWLSVSIIFNIGLLGFFKYYNFFIDSFTQAFEKAGIHLNFTTLSIVLPVGISFYTFQTMSYSLDIYNGKLKPTKDFISFAAFVSFFPQLVAGPIERADNLLPQILSKRSFSYAKSTEGVRQIVWGLFKKVVIADSLAPSVNAIFENYAELQGFTLALGIVFFAFQIYCDFSGYSDIAIGVAKLFGFQLMTNFRFPYFSRNIGEFWRRWHISLSTWFRDYLYIPLGGSRGSKIISLRNVLVIFLVSGFWHGANWTFIIWGAIHALLFIPSLLLGTNKKFKGTDELNSLIPSLTEVGKIAITFCTVCIAWVFFRADSVQVAMDYIIQMFTTNPLGHTKYKKEIIWIIPLILIEWFVMRKSAPAPYFKNKIIHDLFYFVLAIFILRFFSREAEFIYFDF